MNTGLKTDLDRLAALAYHRLEASGDVVQKFHRRRKAFALHADFALLEKAVAWLFAPLTLWPVDFDGLVREAMACIETGRRLSGEMRLLINLLPALPDAKAQAAAMQHEHAVQHGNYESLIHAQHKFDSMEARLAGNAAFQADWQAIKARFDVAKYQDHKRIIRRRMVAERSMRNDLAFRWNTKAARFQAVFDVFCQRWNLYGMQRNKPLLLKLTANLTPFGTMVFIPAYWSFDPKRDLNWHAITAMHKARGVPKQGPKLTPNQLAQKREAEHAAQLMAEAAGRGLKGEARNSWVMARLGWDNRTDERKLRRLLKSFPSLSG
jgi:hypothetical protein